MPGRPRGIGEQGQILGTAALDLGFDISRMRGAEFAARRLDLIERLQHTRLIVTKPARIVVDHQFQVRQPGLQRQDLVDLLLVLSHDHRDLGVVQHKDQLAGDRILIHRNSGAAEALGGELRPIEARPVVADYRQLVAAPESVSRETKGEIVHLSPVFGPSPGPPNAVLLFADRGALSHRLGVAPQQPRQCARGHAALSSRSLAVPR